MTSLPSASLFSRIKERCNSETHLFLDLASHTCQQPINGSDLVAIAERIGADLARRAPNHLILINLDRCSSFIPVFWGCLTAGLTCLPLPMAATKQKPSGSDLEQLEELVAKAGSVAVVYDETTTEARTWLSHCADVRWLPLSSLLIQGSSADVATESTSEHDIAFLVQTSGTTGRWKYAAFSDDWYDYEQSNTRRILSLFPLGSSTGVGYAYALNGLSAYLPLLEGIRNPDAILQAIEDHRIQTLIIPPVMAAGLLRHFKAPSTPLRKRDLSSLDKVNIGSSSISPHDADELSRFLRNWGAISPLIHFAYGLTETGGVAYGPLEEPSQHQHSEGLRIGPISPGVEVRILNKDANNSGCIEVKRPFSFLGYLDLDTWTLNRFRSGSEWFQTGDLGLVDDGQLIISGRTKDTIVINSRKISLATIESHCRECWSELFEDVVACASPKEELLLFVSCSEIAATLGPGDLRQHIEQEINRKFGLPLAELIQLEAADIPRTSTGKVKKQRLVSRWLGQNRSAPAQERMPAEPILSKFNSSVLELLQTALLKEARIFQPADPHQPVSSFGLDSLSLAQIIGNIERQTGLSCQLEACPQNPTLIQLSNLFQANTQEIKTTSSRPSPQHVADLDRYPQREALAHRIKAQNLQMDGHVVGPEKIIRCFNASAPGAPLVVIGNAPASTLQLMSKTIINHPIYYLRLSWCYRRAASNHYLAACCVDWLEACLPEASPTLVGICLGGIIVRHIAQQLWDRPHRARLAILADWNPKRLDVMPPYPGRVIYHVHEWYWERDPSVKQTFERAVRPQTPKARFLYTTYGNTNARQYMDPNLTIKMMSDILCDPRLKPLLDQR